MCWWLLVALSDGKRLHGHSVLCATDQESFLLSGYMHSHKTKNKTKRKGSSLSECLWGATACWAILNTAYTVKRLILIAEIKACWVLQLMVCKRLMWGQTLSLWLLFRGWSTRFQLERPWKSLPWFWSKALFVTNELHNMAPNPSQSLWGWMKRKFATPMPKGINHIQTAWECCSY